MFIKYHELRELCYVGQALLGFLFLGASIYQLDVAHVAAAPLFHMVTGLVLQVVGIGCLFFALEAYLLRDDPDIWN